MQSVVESDGLGFVTHSVVLSAAEVMSMDQRLLKIILENHILKNKVVLGELYNGQQLETIGGKHLRVFIYRTVCPLLWTFAQMLWLCRANNTLPNLNMYLSLCEGKKWVSSLLTCGFSWQAVCIENSCLIRGSKEGSDGALHLTKTLLKPAEKTMYEILVENGGFKWVQHFFLYIWRWD